MKAILSILLLTASFSLLPSQAQPPGRGHGRGGPGGGGGGGGPLPAEARDVIHSLFSDHDKIERKVTLTDTGYTARTVSDDPKIAAALKEHVSFMENRLDGGFPVRRWDPAFAEFFDHYDDLETTIHKIEKGLEVVVKGKTPEAIKVAQNHARIISGFVKEGEKQHHAEHETALGKEQPQPAGRGRGRGHQGHQGGECDKCEGECQCDKGEGVQSK